MIRRPIVDPREYRWLEVGQLLPGDVVLSLNTRQTRDIPRVRTSTVVSVTPELGGETTLNLIVGNGMGTLRRRFFADDKLPVRIRAVSTDEMDWTEPNLVPQTGEASETPTESEQTMATRPSDRAALDSIALILGSNNEWSEDDLSQVADLIGGTGRPHPGSVAAIDYPKEWDRYRFERSERARPILMKIAAYQNLVDPDQTDAESIAAEELIADLVHELAKLGGPR